MLIIVDCFEEWKYYFKSSAFIVRVLCDYMNLQSFIIIKTLNRRQIRWTEFLSSFDFEIIHRKNKKNPADALSRKPDYYKTAVIENRKKKNSLQNLILQRINPTKASSLINVREAILLELGTLLRSEIKRSRIQRESL